MNYHLLLALLLALLGVACRQDPDEGGRAILSSPAQLAVEAGCDSLPADHDLIYKRGTELINPYMTLHDRAAAQGSEREMRLKAGIACLDRALNIAPSNWAALWVRGKAFQALGDHVRAYESFKSAYAIQSQNQDVGRELVIECLENGKSAEAVTIADRLTKLAPQDAGLRANLALALLLDGQLQGSRDAITDALRLDPGDPISKALEERINQVIHGSRPQPKTLRELAQ